MDTPWATAATVADRGLRPAAKGNTYVNERAITLVGGAPQTYFVFVVTDAVDNVEEIIYEDNNLSAPAQVEAYVLPGDANRDCNVNILDLIFVRNHLGTKCSP